MVSCLLYSYQKLIIFRGKGKKTTKMTKTEGGGEGGVKQEIGRSLISRLISFRNHFMLRFSFSQPM